MCVCVLCCVVSVGKPTKQTVGARQCYYTIGKEHQLSRLCLFLYLVCQRWWMFFPDIEDYHTLVTLLCYVLLATTPTKQDG